MTRRRAFTASGTPRRTLLLIALVVWQPMASAQEEPAVIPRTNPPATVAQRIGVTDVTVRYNRPSLKGRKVFGDLIPFDRLWRTGSDEATTITLSTPVTVQGRVVPEGDYALFTIPSLQSWTVILNRQPKQWGSYSYDSANDVLRVEVVPIVLDRPVESLMFTFDEVTAGSAMLNLAWERTRLPIPIRADVVALTVPRIEAAMKAPGRKPYFLAAMFYFEHALDITRAAEWMAAALQESPGHIGMLHRQALILEKKGDRAAALAAAEASLAGAAKSPPELREEYTRLNAPLIARLKPQR